MSAKEQKSNSNVLTVQNISAYGQKLALYQTKFIEMTIKRKMILTQPWNSLFIKLSKDFF